MDRILNKIVSGKTRDAGEQKARSRHFLWLRALVGLCILAAILLWVIDEGVLLERLNGAILAWSTLISIATSLLHAATLSSVASAYGRKLDYRYALYISALGSLGNAAGGLPVGTTLKYIILYKRVGLKIGQITFGLTAYTVMIALVLLGYAAISAPLLNLETYIKAVPVLLLIGSIIVVTLLVRWGQGNRNVSALLHPFLEKRYFFTVAGLGIALASLFMINSCIVGNYLFPEHSFVHIIFLSATGIFMGLVSLLQSIAGIQEITMGLSALASGLDPIDGVQIALVLRMASIISSGIFLGLFYLSPNRHRHS